MSFLLAASALIVLAGLAGVALSRNAVVASTTAASGIALGCALALVPALRVLTTGESLPMMRIPWQVPAGEIMVGLDPLSAFFLVPVLLLSGLAAVYGRGYMLPYAATRGLGGSWLWLAGLVVGMIGVLVARSALFFLFTWEAMTLSAYLLVTFEHDHAAVRRAGWVYLAASHVGLALLTFMFLLVGRHAGGLGFDRMARMAELAPSASTLVLVVAIAGFGVKAGLAPLHVWLPEAHAAAPSHVSALMSGVMIKMGVYGILRVLAFVGRPAPLFGPLFIVLGLSTALFGICLAAYQRDLKRALAYSSIENVGIITVGIGVGLVGTWRGDPVVAVLGWTGALLHVWNHALMKGLMFLCAGSVLHGAGSKDLERLGGVLRRMPWTGAAMVVGATAISALPPLNGFVGEWLLYLGLLRTGQAQVGAAGVVALLAVGVVALVGAIACLTFARIVGVAVLGQPRSEAASRAHESPAWMLVPMAALVVLSVAVALVPGPVVGMLRYVLGGLAPEMSWPNVQRFAIGQSGLLSLAAVNAGIWVAAGVFAVLLSLRLSRRPRRRGPTWDCGYGAPSSAMQYTASSFSQIFAERTVPSALRARVDREAPMGPFPTTAQFSTSIEDPLSRGVYGPLLSRAADRFARLRWLQQGALPIYLSYILVFVLLGLAWLSVRTWGGT